MRPIKIKIDGSDDIGVVIYKSDTVALLQITLNEPAEMLNIGGPDLSIIVGYSDKSYEEIHIPEFNEWTNFNIEIVKYSLRITLIRL